MRAFVLFAIVVFMSILTEAQSLPVLPAVTDPKQITSRPNGTVEKSLSIEKLYSTRQVGRSDWSPDGKQIVFVSISGRPFRRGRPMESGSRISPITTATSSGTSSSFRRRPVS